MMDPKIIIIISVALYGIINVIRVLHNIKNKEYFLKIYPAELKEKWLKIYANPIAFLFQSSLLRIIIIVVFVFYIFQYGKESDVVELFIGVIYYLSFVTIFEELKAFIEQTLMLKKIKEEKINETRPKEIYESLLIAVPVCILIGLVPLLFLIKEFKYDVLGSLIGGAFYLLLHIGKVMRAKVHFKKAAASSENTGKISFYK